MPFRRSGRGPLTACLVDVEQHELAWPTDNGNVCLDLVATIGERWGRRFERLRTPADLSRWLCDVGVLDTEPAASVEDLQLARDLRAAIYACVEAAVDGGTPSRAALLTLNRHAAVPPPAPRLEATLRVTWHAVEAPSAALAVIARDAVALISGPDLARVRECAAVDCSRVFVDRSNPGTRRWCSMRTCGNRAKVRSLRRREQANPPRRGDDVIGASWQSFGTRP